MATVDLTKLAAEINGDEALKADGVWCRHELKATEHEYVIVYSNDKYARMSVMPNGTTRQPDRGIPCWPVLGIVKAAIGIRLVPHLAGDAARTEEE